MKLIDPGPDIVWLGHDSFRITGEQVIYIDPFQLSPRSKLPKADIILVTHEHFDHLSLEDINRVSGPDTIIVAPAEGAAKLKGRKVQFVKPGDKVTVKGIAIEAVPAYNTSKFRSPGVHFHPKADDKVGFIITVTGCRVYHAGDTDLIPEMSDVVCDIALIPVGGTYTMTAEEGAQAANLLKPKMAVPMHYGTIVGNDSHAELFKKLCRVPVTVMKAEVG
jgi:L-ascorbate metabolism protein UlaG (beta-lactamase superfamily)